MDRSERKAFSGAVSLFKAPCVSIIEIIIFASLTALLHSANADEIGNDGFIGLIGDSIMVGTNSDQTCGAGREILDCMVSRFGQQDLSWSHGGGDHAWAIARRLGYSSSQIMNVSDDDEQWRDALSQAKRITANPAVNAVFIHMGANDVCAEFGHDYTGDLDKIEQHIDSTLQHLVTRLRPGSQIYWSGIVDIVRFRDVMVNRSHNYMFRNCRALWDLDSDEITEEAAQSLCKDEGINGGICENLADWAEARERIMDYLLDYYLDKYDVREGYCGRVLDSANTQAERDEARLFNKALNELFARKATEYNGVNGVNIIFTNALYDTQIEPNYVSRLDCYHPNRAGQMKLAQELWKGFNQEQENIYTYWFDEFNDQDWCTEEFASPWASCWYDYGDPGFDIRVDGEGWLRVQKDTGRNRKRYVVRHVGDLSEMSGAWMSFNHKRENLDDGEDRVFFKVYKEGVWHQLDRFEGSGNDVGVHNGKYYDLSPFLSHDLRIMFETENQRSMKDGDRVKFDNFNIFAWGDAIDFEESKLIEADQLVNIVNSSWYHQSTWVDLPVPAVVLASIATFNDNDVAGLRMQNLNSGGFEIMIEEEQSVDLEIEHNTESVSYAVFAPGLIKDVFGNVIGEAGIINQQQVGSDTWYIAQLQGSYLNPIVIMNLTTYNGSNASHIRLRRNNGQSFKYKIEEWDYLDQIHVNETIAFIVVESGMHELPEGRNIEAGAVETDHQWSKIPISTNLANTSIILSQSQTYHGSQAIVTRQKENVDGFYVRLQEEEANDGIHLAESVGYVAIN